LLPRLRRPKRLPYWVKCKIKKKNDPAFLINIEFAGFFFYIGHFVMKINIQNLEHDLLEIDEEVELNFLDQALLAYYPNKADVHVALDKFGKDYRLKVHIATIARYVCDRCLGPYAHKFKAVQSQIYQIGGTPMQDQDQIKYLPANTIEIDITPLLREMFILEHPIKMLCKNECKGICPHCGANLNTEACRCGSQPVDLRWEKLRKLIK